jgi:hypothetical protein
MYNDLLNRMQSLLQRQDVQAVLSSVDPTEQSPTSGKDSPAKDADQSPTQPSSFNES